MKKRIWNLGILAHVDAGKTTVTEGFLYHSGLLSHMGNVDKGTTVTDSMDLEQKRGMTIRASTVSFEVDGVKINLIDTPGHMDFIAEVERSLSVLDGVILVLSAKEGVQPQTRVIFNQLRNMRMPVILFVNKIDRAGIDFTQLAGQIRSQLTDKAFFLQEVLTQDEGVPTPRAFRWEEEAFAERLLVTSDRLTERYLEGSPITAEEYEALLRFRIGKALLYPVLFGSALKDIGIRELLHGVVRWSAPEERPEQKALSAYVYKIEWDGKHRKKAYVRIFSGELRIRRRVLLVRTGEEIVIRNLLRPEQGKQKPAESIQAGDIGILCDMEELRCGDYLGSVYRRKGLSEFARPLLQVEIRPVSCADRACLLSALEELACEDPLLSVRIREETGEITLQLFGRLQQEILAHLLEERYKIRVRFDELKTICRETPSQPASAGIRISDRDNLRYAGIELLVEPLPEGSGFVYETQVSYGFIEKSFQNAVREGVEQGIRRGLSDSVTDVKVTFTGADYDSVKSTPADYRRLAPEVVKKALLLSGVKRLEPFMRFRLTAPAGCEKPVFSALTGMEAQIEATEYLEDEIRIRGLVFFDAAKDYPPLLLSVTEGKGIFEMEFYSYRHLPDTARSNRNC